MIERGAELGGGLVAIVGLLLQRLRDHGLELAEVHARQHVGEPRRRLLEVHRDDLHRIVALGVKRLVCGEQLEQEHAARVEVAARIDAGAADLLGRHVRRRADDDARRQLRGLRLLGQARETEVEDLHVIAEADLLPEHDVRGLDVAVDDAELVRVRDAGQGLLHDLDGARDRDRALVDQRLEIGAGDVVHHDVRLVVVHADVEHRRAVRVLELGHRHRLELEPLAAGQLVRQLVVEDLDRDDLAELQPLGAIDDTHRALSDRFQDLVATVEDGAGEIPVGHAISLARPPTRH